MQITPGLGQSEVFYSSVLMLFHGGATFGALLAALLVRVTPYWYLLLFSLTIHTLSYVMYGMAASSWIIAVSKFLSGLFIGMEKTVTFAYFGESYSDYLGALEELGREESKRTRMKDRLFALHSIGVNIGFLIGPGLSAVNTASLYRAPYDALHIAIGKEKCVLMARIFTWISSNHDDTSYYTFVSFMQGLVWSLLTLMWISFGLWPGTMQLEAYC